MVMPSGVMDRRHLSEFGLPSDSSSSFFSEEVRFPERQVGFWKPEPVADQKGSKSVFPSAFEKLHPTGANPAAGGVEHTEAHTSMDQMTKFSMMGQEKSSSLPSASWGDARMNYGSRFDLFTKERAFLEPASIDRCVNDYENGLFASSFSEMFNNKLRLASNGVLGQSLDTNNSNYGEEEPIESIEEIEAQTIGNLLPDDDDLISGVIDDFECTGLSTIQDDVDEDIFCTGGGMELETDDAVKGSKTSEGSLNGQFSGQHPYGENPSRTLFVSNINSNIEDSELRVLFQQYGDIRALHTAYKHRGFVMISYYDIRSAQSAMMALQNKPLRFRNLDIHFSVPKGNPSDKDINQGTLVVCNLHSSVSNDDLHRIFGIYGEIKEIRDTPKICDQKLIEFYDVRAAKASLHALNRSDIAGQKIKVEPSHPEGPRQCLTQQYSLELEQKECGRFLQQPNNFPSGYAAAPQKSTSPITIESVGQHNNQSALVEHSESLGQKSFGRGMHVFHPHSLPEYHNGVSYNSSSIPVNSVNLCSRVTEGVDGRRLHKVVSGGVHGHSFDQGEAFGVSGIGSCPLHGHHYIWNNSNAFQHNPSSPMLWPNSPSHPLHHIHGFPRVTPHMMNTAVLPLDQHHLGSAAAYGGNFAEIPSFHQGSLGSMGFPGSPQLYPSELAIFPHNRGNREPMFSPVSVGFPSPQQRHVFPGRNPMIHMSGSYDASNDRMRSRRHDGSANQTDNKKQYELDIDRIAHGEDTRTTLMIKNIPNKYTCKMLLAVIDEHHRGTYDFIYLPIDFKNKCNVGYAFINMTDPQHIVPFYKTFNGKKWEKFNSEKVATLAYARIQGRAALIAHFQNSSLMNEDKRCRPMLFHTDGPNAGDQEPFPVGTNIRSRSGRNRGFSHPEPHQESPSTSPNRETSSSGADDSPSGSTKDPLE